MVRDGPARHGTMTSLNDKAEEPEYGTMSISDAADHAGSFRIEDTDLDPAEDVGTDQYPQYGDWLPVTILQDGAAVGDGYVECPHGLAAAIVEAELETGDSFAVTDLSKDRNGRWDVAIEAGE